MSTPAHQMLVLGLMLLKLPIGLLSNPLIFLSFAPTVSTVLSLRPNMFYEILYAECSITVLHILTSVTVLSEYINLSHFFYQS